MVLKFVQNSLYELEFEPGSADLVISNSFLEHLPDCELAVEFIESADETRWLQHTRHRRFRP